MILDIVLHFTDIGNYRGNFQDCVFQVGGQYFPLMSNVSFIGYFSQALSSLSLCSREHGITYAHCEFVKSKLGLSDSSLPSFLLNSDVPLGNRELSFPFSHCALGRLAPKPASLPGCPFQTLQFD